MDKKLVKDVMVSIADYPSVFESDNLMNAVDALEEGQKRLPPGRQPYRAVLIVDYNENVIGKIGQLAFLKAMEPKFNLLGDLGKLASAGVSSEMISSMMQHFQFFQDNMNDLCLRARSLPVRDIMQPVTESIDENASLREGIHKMVILQTLSVLVTRNGRAVGLLRLSDVYDEIAQRMKECRQSSDA